MSSHEEAVKQGVAADAVMTAFPGLLSGIPLPNASGETGPVFWVDGVNGDSGNDGSMDAPLDTIQAAVNLARYLPGTTTIDDSKERRKMVLVLPGHYNEQVLFSGYNIDVIGLGPRAPGKDYGVVLNYDGAIASTCVLGFSGSGIRVCNMTIVDQAAIPAVYIAGGDNNVVEDCFIECDGTLATYGVHADSMKGSWLRNLVIQSPATAGIYVAGGANHYFIQGGIEECMIQASVAGAKGIYVENTVTAYLSRIFRNFIDVEGAGTTAKGIDVDSTGNVFVADNYITIETGATAAEHAGHGMLNNHVSTNGTVTDPFDDD